MLRCRRKRGSWRRRSSASRSTKPTCSPSRTNSRTCASAPQPPRTGMKYLNISFFFFFFVSYRLTGCRYEEASSQLASAKSRLSELSIQLENALESERSARDGMYLHRAPICPCGVLNTCAEAKRLSGKIAQLEAESRQERLRFEPLMAEREAEEERLKKELESLQSHILSLEHDV